MNRRAANDNLANLVQQMAKMSAQRGLRELERSLLELVGVLLRQHSVRFYSLRGNDQNLEVRLLHRLDEAGGYHKVSPRHWQAPDQHMRDAILHSDDTPGPWHQGDTTWQVIRQRNRRTALIVVENGPLDEQEEGFLAAIMLIHENYLRLLYDAERDMLTGLLNRRSFDTRLYELMSQPGQHYTLALLDIDHFKQVNDRFGHIVGDEVLLRISQLMTDTLGSGVQFYRYGGEEFAALLRQGQDGHSAPQQLETLRHRIAATDFPQVGQVTLSIGHVQIDQQPLPANVVEQADKALYHAKEHGRNQVVDYAQLLAQGLVSPQGWPQGDVELF
ncbi:diguanylate cyclase domain-containing protein [Vogesella sp. LIG4]|uniref:diguanylate cyclase domain-containing protein n=1 Tax=Vogesella sp. LIG4 TaxID=1192162 RepID=UPI00081FC386|nr:diguanylate cyclase [Vogesella sp. LIG4]SCK21773.1 diguanylate cyclase (GGDEF) domain-containing protein [Vogesella sp. LIG4]